MKPSSNPPRTPMRHQSGTTLIEVLTSILILSVGVLGMISVQSSAMRFLQSSRSQGEAALLVNDLADRMRANSAIATSDNVYVHSFEDSSSGDDTQTSSVKSCVDNACSRTELAAYDLDQWQQQLADALPGCSAAVERTATAGTGGATTDDFLITVRWDDDRSGSTGTECDPALKTADDLDCWQLTVSF